MSSLSSHTSLQNLVGLEDFEQWFGNQLKQQKTHPILNQAICYAALDGGKRFRALCTLLTSQLLKKTLASVYPAAAAIEMIHAYSLIHDDLPALDNAQLRRGKPTVHKKFSESIAILAGDALLTDAFGMLTKTIAPADGLVKAIGALAHAAGSFGMVAGQMGDILDLATAKDFASTRAIHAKKTGALIHFALLCPFILWEPDHPQRNIIETYSEHLGVLFQLKDDLLDVDPLASKDKDRHADGAKKTFATHIAHEVILKQELAACLEQTQKLPPPHDMYFGELVTWTIGRKN